MAGVKGLTPGRVSPPVLTQFGYHLIRVDAVKGDSLKLRHILVPIELQGEHLDAVEARVDSVERLAADQANGALLDSAARRFTLPVSPVYRIVDGERLTLGRYVVPDVSVWAFEARVRSSRRSPPSTSSGSTRSSPQACRRCPKYALRCWRRSGSRSRRKSRSAAPTRWSRRSRGSPICRRRAPRAGSRWSALAGSRGPNRPAISGKSRWSLGRHSGCT